MNKPSYYWTWDISVGCAVLYEQEKERIYYDKKSLSEAIRNVTKNQRWYVSKKAWLDHLTMFSDGLVLFREHVHYAKD